MIEIEITEETFEELSAEGLNVTTKFYLILDEEGRAIAPKMIKHRPGARTSRSQLVQVDMSCTYRMPGNAKACMKALSISKDHASTTPLRRDQLAVVISSNSDISRGVASKCVTKLLEYGHLKEVVL